MEDIVRYRRRLSTEPALSTDGGMTAYCRAQIAASGLFLPPWRQLDAGRERLH